MSIIKPKSRIAFFVPPISNPFDIEEIITCPTCGEQVNLIPPELNQEKEKCWQCRACGRLFASKPGQTYLGL